MTAIKRLYDAHDLAETLGISRATIRSAAMVREDRPVPSWFRAPLPRKINGGHVWDDTAVSEMLEEWRTRRGANAQA